MPKKSFIKGKRKGKGSRTRKQKMYNMKGCSKSKQCRSKKMRGGLGCGPFGCPIAPFSWKQMQQGGDCSVSQCAPILGTGQTGGNFYKPPAPIPGPFEGDPWTPAVSGWPGVNGVGGSSNYLAQNLYNHGDPQTMMKLGGSRRKHKGRKHRYMNKSMRGGLIPQDLVNLKNDLVFNLTSASNALNGYPPPTNPLPYRDQLSGSSLSNRALV